MTVRKPTNLKVLEGNLGKRPLNHDEPQPEVGVDCPAWLSAAAKKEWKRIKPVLEACRILTKADMALLSMYCQAWADYESTTKKLNKMKTKTIKGGPHGRRIAPEVNLQKNYYEIIQKTGAKLGLSPSDRTGIKVQSARPKSKWSDIQ